MESKKNNKQTDKKKKRLIVTENKLMAVRGEGRGRWVKKVKENSSYKVKKL